MRLGQTAARRFVVALCGFITFGASNVMAQVPSLNVIPQRTEAQLRLHITASEIVDVAGWQLDVLYDSIVLRFASFELGGLLSANGATHPVDPIERSMAAGPGGADRAVTLAVVRAEPGSVTGAGTVGIAVFDVLTTAATSVQLSAIRFVDPTGATIPVTASASYAIGATVMRGNPIADATRSVTFGSPVAFFLSTLTGFTIAWDFGDGTTGQGLNVSHSYAAIGTYTVVMRATRDGIVQLADTVVINVTPTIPVLTARVDNQAGTTFTVREGDTLTALINVVDATKTDTVIIAATGLPANATLPTTSGLGGVLGTLTFAPDASQVGTTHTIAVTATDDTGASASLTLTIIVQPKRIPEDLDGNGVIDLLDLVRVARVFGTNDPLGDVNGDGVVNLVDLVLIASKFGQRVTAAPARLASMDAVSAAELHRWIADAEPLNDGSAAFRRGMSVLRSLARAITPTETRLLANYPNPFNPETWIPYELSQAADVSAVVYDAGGRVVRRFDLGRQETGRYVRRGDAIY
ncbi:MAG: PKD domain-containing protein, partial [Candidatus Poribacteria bacterium]|nr:PKD domain-containing protein [Candidatus Poribacteria bacterium]